MYKVHAFAGKKDLLDLKFLSKKGDTYEIYCSYKDSFDHYFFSFCVAVLCVCFISSWLLSSVFNR